MEYDKAMMDELDYQSAIHTAKVEGRAEGILAMAKAMKAEGYELSAIAKLSGLTVKQIEALE